jgi:hypothetical protein
MISIFRLNRTPDNSHLHPFSFPLDQNQITSHSHSLAQLSSSLRVSLVKTPTQTPTTSATHRSPLTHHPTASSSVARGEKAQTNKKMTIKDAPLVFATFYLPLLMSSSLLSHSFYPLPSLPLTSLLSSPISLCPLPSTSSLPSLR